MNDEQKGETRAARECKPDHGSRDTGSLHRRMLLPAASLRGTRFICRRNGDGHRMLM
jgi:hypothetical protein